MFRKRPPAVVPEWLIVGLGNPGPEYRGTRHNIGFEVIDQLALAHGIKVDRGVHRALTGLGRVESYGVCLAKPLTYMNLSGQAVGALARSHGIAPSHVLVIADDVDLGCGVLRLRAEGSSGGHNGHKSIIAALQTQEYPRLKIGVGRGADDTRDHVLDKFKPDERKRMDEAVAWSRKVVEVLLARGMQPAQALAAEFNKDLEF